jgi:hypothetical protein
VAGLLWHLKYASSMSVIFPLATVAVPQRCARVRVPRTQTFASLVRIIG